MAISVHCDECDKTFQVRDNLAGRRGRCPKGHPVRVPNAAEAPAPAPENEFSFLGDSRFSEPDEEPAPAPKAARRRPVAEPEPAAAAPADDFSFPTPSLLGDDRNEEPAPKAGRHRRPEPKAAAKHGKAAGKPSMMPLYLGGLMFLLGIGGGIAMLVVSRGEAGPLRERAEAADKKAAEAAEKAAKADALRVLAETNLEAAKKNPPKDPALAEAQKKLKESEKRATDAERKLADAGKGGAVAAAGAGGAAMPAKPEDLDPSAPGGKDDPVMPRGKLGKADPKMEAEMKGPNKADPKMAPKKADPKGEAGKPAADVPDGIPLGGKNWNVPSSIPFAGGDFKGGDRISLWPQEDAAPKVADGKLTIKYKWKLRKGKELPESAVVGLVVQEAKGFRMTAIPVTITGAGDAGEATFDAKAFKGKQPIFVFLGSDRAAPGATAYSSMISFQVDFGGEPKE